jgi:tetrahydromethanopterin S-methyltransferase subunit G
LNTESRLDERVDRVEERIKSELSQLEQRMTIKLGSMLVIAVGVIVAAQKLW